MSASFTVTAADSVAAMKAQGIRLFLSFAAARRNAEGEARAAAAAKDPRILRLLAEAAQRHADGSMGEPDDPALLDARIASLAALMGAPATKEDANE